LFEKYTTSVIDELQFYSKLLDDVLAATEGYRTVTLTMTKREKMNDIGDRKEIIIKKAYCMKCRYETEIRNPREVYTRNGKPAIEGGCSKCGSSVYKIGRK
jgi:hypothetical protein